LRLQASITAMITDRQKFTTKRSLYGMSIPLRDVSFSFLPLESIRSHSAGLYTLYKKPPQIFSCLELNSRLRCRPGVTVCLQQRPQRQEMPTKSHV